MCLLVSYMTEDDEAASGPDSRQGGDMPASDVVSAEIPLLLPAVNRRKKGSVADGKQLPKPASGVPSPESTGFGYSSFQYQNLLVKSGMFVNMEELM